MLNKERLLKISELDGDRIIQLDESNLNLFAITVNSFIDGFPIQEENVKNALKANDREALAKSLSIICDALQKIYAKQLTEACLYQLKFMNTAQFEDLQSFVINFIKTVSALSIDLQMIEFQDTHTAPLAASKTTGKNTILAVDDVEFFLNTIKSMLNNSGYKVTCVKSGMLALNYLKNHSPDLFILDIEMPVMDGYELARRIKASGHNAPIIFLTGNSKKESVIKALEAGAVDFLVKPVAKEQLLERIGKFIKPETEYI